MPKIFEFGRYVFFFWSAENGEPIHVHVAVKTPSEHSSKIWLTRAGGISPNIVIVEPRVSWNMARRAFLS